MEAKASVSYHVNAFSGRKYVPYEWRPVPTGCEEEAGRNPYLDTRESQQVASEDIDATDAALELAAEHDIDLSMVEGTGSDGRILKSDVQSLIEAE